MSAQHRRKGQGWVTRQVDAELDVRRQARGRRLSKGEASPLWRIIGIGVALFLLLRACGGGVPPQDQVIYVEPTTTQEEGR